MRRSNALADRLNSGGIALGAQNMIQSPSLVEIYGNLGIDFIWMDMEHGGHSSYDSPNLEHLTRAAEVSDCELVVRIPSTDDALIRKVLDAGVRNIVVPRVRTAEEVESAIRAARFNYRNEIGDRGVGSGRTSLWGLDLDTSFGKDEDASVLVGIMIENVEAVENLDEILALHDLGFVFVGPNDLAVSMGYPLQPNHTEVQRTKQDIKERCIAADVPFMDAVEKEGPVRDLIKEGVQMIRITSGEATVIQNAVSPRLAAINEYIE